MMAGTIIGGILGTVFGLTQGYLQKRAMDRQKRLAEKQFQLQKRQMQIEEQERAKANQREADVEGLLRENTSSPFGESVLAGARSFGIKNPLNEKNRKLGG